MKIANFRSSLRFYLLFILFAIFAQEMQAQDKRSSSENRRTIEIDNDNGALSITFENGIIKEFIVNDTAVAMDLYGDYQKIIDQFSDEKKIPTPPKTPNYSIQDNHESDKFQKAIIDHLIQENIIKSASKYTVYLERKFLKVDGEKQPNQAHQECLNIFDEIYGHQLNLESKVKFSKSKNNSTSSFSIVD